MSDFNWKITPAEFLRSIGAVFKKRGSWLQLSVCLFCGGGSSNDKYSLNIHETDGNYFCHRSKCSMRGSFWKFIEMNDRDPRDYLGERTKRKTRKRFIFGKYDG